MKDTINVGSIDNTKWEDNTREDDEPEFSTLHGSTEIYGVPFHITAIAVENFDEGQLAVDSGAQEDLDCAIRINEGGYFATVVIPGFSFNYVLIVLPYTD